MQANSANWTCGQPQQPGRQRARAACGMPTASRSVTEPPCSVASSVAAGPPPADTTPCTVQTMTTDQPCTDCGLRPVRMVPSNVLLCDRCSDRRVAAISG